MFGHTEHLKGFLLSDSSRNISKIRFHAESSTNVSLNFHVHLVKCVIELNEQRLELLAMFSLTKHVTCHI